jgi:3-methyl-2-oxobutanoate hydroxymethyltransferase
MKSAGEKISMLTCYDYPTARILDESGIDILLVGDSVGVVFRVTTTLPVTMDEMIYHSRCRCPGEARRSSLSIFRSSLSRPIFGCPRQRGTPCKGRGAEAVKLEGGENVVESIKAIVDMDIPVMAHIGLTPQSIHRMGATRFRGKTERAGEQLLGGCPAVQSAGAFSVVLEGIP